MSEKRITQTIPTFHISGMAREASKRLRAKGQDDLGYLIETVDKVSQEVRWQSERAIDLDERLYRVELDRQKDASEMESVKNVKRILIWIGAPVGTVLTLILGSVIGRFLEKHM